MLQMFRLLQWSPLYCASHQLGPHILLLAGRALEQLLRVWTTGVDARTEDPLEDLLREAGVPGFRSRVLGSADPLLHAAALRIVEQSAAAAAPNGRGNTGRAGAFLADALTAILEGEARRRNPRHVLPL